MNVLTVINVHTFKKPQNTNIKDFKLLSTIFEWKYKTTRTVHLNTNSRGFFEILKIWNFQKIGIFKKNIDPYFSKINKRAAIK